jgi:hypothetical protein
MGGKMKRSELSDLPWPMKWLFGSVITKIVIALIMLVVVGGTGYILFGYNEDSSKINKMILDMDNVISQEEAFNDMLNIFANGWNKSSDNNWDKISKIITKAKTTIGIPLSSLDEKFVAESSNILSAAITRLNFERGSVQGFQFHDKFLQRGQSVFVSIYDTKIKAIESLRELILNWDTTSNNNRASMERCRRCIAECDVSKRSIFDIRRRRV